MIFICLKERYHLTSDICSLSSPPMYTVQCGGGLYIFPNISKYQVLMFVESQVLECHLRAGAGASCSLPLFVHVSLNIEEKNVVYSIRIG